VFNHFSLRLFGRAERVDGDAEIQDLFRLPVRLRSRFAKGIILQIHAGKASMVRIPGRRNRTANGPGLETGGISQEENNSVRSFHLEVIVGNPGRVDAAFIPAVQDFQNFNPPVPIRERPGRFLPLVSGITLHGRFFKNPFFFHFNFTTERTENTEKIIMKNLREMDLIFQAFSS
jgi:hypothetical protein